MPQEGTQSSPGRDVDTGQGQAGSQRGHVEFERDFRSKMPPSLAIPVQLCLLSSAPLTLHNKPIQILSGKRWQTIIFNHKSTGQRGIADRLR